jgi:hypothetical protein
MKFLTNFDEVRATGLPPYMEPVYLPDGPLSCETLAPRTTRGVSDSAAL